MHEVFTPSKDTKKIGRETGRKRDGKRHREREREKEVQLKRNQNNNSYDNNENLLCKIEYS